MMTNDVISNGQRQGVKRGQGKEKKPKTTATFRWGEFVVPSQSCPNEVCNVGKKKKKIEAKLSRSGKVN
jgi:hypothetical protein